MKDADDETLTEGSVDQDAGSTDDQEGHENVEPEEGDASDLDVEIEENLEEAQDDQEAIDKAWIKSLNINYPLHSYYKFLKRSISIVLGSHRIATHAYPDWS